MTFPTKADIEFFIEHQEELPEWEPRTGDWYTVTGETVNVVYFSGVEHVHGFLGFNKQGKFFIPRPDQLWEMLEEQGYQWATGGGPHEKPVAKDDYYFGDCALPGRCMDDPIQKFGSTSAIALAKCLIEVMNNG